MASDPARIPSSPDMNTINETLFEAFLAKHDDDAWDAAVNELAPHIHDVDKTATRIWFKFYPVALARALKEAADPESLAAELLLQGDYHLKSRIDSSHTFLYGHRYWREVKQAVAEFAGSGSPPEAIELSQQILLLASRLAKQVGVDESLLIGISAVAFMTVQQAGIIAFKATPGTIKLKSAMKRESPEQVLRARARDDHQGPLGFLKGEARTYTVTFDESDRTARFKLINTQHITTAGACDKRPYHLRDPRCMRGEGPIPVQCRSGACGTCWVGVLGGAEKLSEVGELEWRRIREFGYIHTDEPKPLIRLACQAQAFGAVSIVIPPWNGVFGKILGSRSKATSDSAGA